MTTEFEKQLNNLALEATTRKQVMKIFSVAGSEFPCLSCPSKEDCVSYKWFVKWFGEEKNT